MRFAEMWYRFVLIVSCFFAVNSLPQSDKVFRRIGNIGSQFSNKGESTAFRDQNEPGKNERGSLTAVSSEKFRLGERERFSMHRPNVEGNLFNPSRVESESISLNREKSGSTNRPADFIQTSDNKKSSQHLTGLIENNEESLVNRRKGSAPSTIYKGDKTPSFGSAGSNTERSPTNRPTDSSGTIQSEFRLNNTEDNTFSLPSKQSIHSSNIDKYDQGTSQLKPTYEKGQFGRPTEESNLNHQTGSQERPSGPETNFCNVTKNCEQNEQTNYSNGVGSKNNESEKENEKDVCFDHLGCFKMGKPWNSILRPIKAPLPPENIQTIIHFYSRTNLEHPQNIIIYPDINMRNAQFDPTKITTILVHGFSSSGNATWLTDMKNAYLKKVNANVMIADWGKGAQLSNYLQVAGNTRVVGKQLALFVKFLIDKLGADPGKFHLIGHSLGAQICSYIGKEVQGIARLTALDPAQPGFEGFDREIRLDPSDAEFVDVIHTDARPFIPTLGFGMIAPHGHVDFYMNGGFDQPGCLYPSKKDLPSVKTFLDLAKYPVEVISKAVSCPHGRAHEYLIESFNETDKCIFWGYKANVKNVFKSVSNTVTQGLFKKFTALSSTCSKENCIPLGFATKKSPLRGVFVVTTNNKPPYCISEPGLPPEIPEEKQNSMIEKLGKHMKLLG